MYISFYLDQEFHSGTATLIEKENEPYLIDLSEALQFTISKSQNGEWASEDNINPDLVRAAGSEIVKQHEGSTLESLRPNIYYSAERTHGENPIFEQGEVINEPADVNEQSERLQ